MKALLAATLLQVESNLLYSARYTYTSLEFPGLTEAVEDSDWPLPTDQAQRLEAALQKNTQWLRSALTDWRGRT